MMRSERVAFELTWTFGSEISLTVGQGGGNDTKKVRRGTRTGQRVPFKDVNVPRRSFREALMGKTTRGGNIGGMAMAVH